MRAVPHLISCQCSRRITLLLARNAYANLLPGDHASINGTAVNTMTEVDAPAEGDDQPERAPLPTNSMITVRLSDVQIHPNDGPSDAHDSSSPASSTASKRSSRSSASISDDSISLNSVDWEGLEKTEEQEPKDEGTDEVQYAESRSTHH